jgi:hypothetical protein
MLDRMVRVFTDRAVFDGLLRLTVLGRTLDELNSTSRTFLLLDSPTLAQDASGAVLAEQLALNKESILFALELDARDSIPSDLRRPGEKTHLAQSVLQLTTAGYTIEGNVHVFQAGNALARIYLPGHPFIALTAVTISAPDFELTTPFLAVNRAHVFSALESCRFDAVMVDGAAEPVADSVASPE